MPRFNGDVLLQGVRILEVPGAKKTTVTGINDHGQVAGHFLDAQGHNHGFLYKEGAYCQIDYPGTGTHILGMNGCGRLVGRGKNGFLYDRGTFSSLNYPGSVLTIPHDVNDFGDVVGTFQNAAGENHGFLYKAGEFYPLPGYEGKETFASAINNSGQIVGGFADDSGTYGFIYLENAGVYSSVLQYPEATVTYPEGINNSGQIVGSFSDSAGNDNPFLYFASSCHKIIIPGATSAGALAVNDHGQVIGHYFDGDNVQAYLGIVLI